MAKKVAISMTIDGGLLKELDAFLGEIQMEQIKRRSTLSTRSGLIEQFIRDGIKRKGSDGERG